MQHSVREAVIDLLSLKVANGVKGAHSFLQSKPALKAKILLDIRNEFNGRHFDNCLCYLTDVEKSLCYWLEQYTVKYCEKGNFADIVSTEVSILVEFLTNIVHDVSKEFSQKPGKFKIAI